MTKPKPKPKPKATPKATPKPAHRPPPRPDSVFREAGERMSADLDRLLPAKLRRRDKKQFVLWLLLRELAVLGGLGALVYRWWGG